MTKHWYEELPVDSIVLDVDNPRIRSCLENHNNITAEVIALALNDSSSSNSTSYNSLVKSIRQNGGIINPILVNKKDENGQTRYVVIEGNTRVQIYKDCISDKVPGSWATIPCVVYDNMTDDEIHAIRLQCHLVGPRDWDPFSKAKYLYQLSREELLPMETIIDYCGGKRGEINKLISAYDDVVRYYIPEVNKRDDRDFDVRDFSKFVELQNPKILNAIKRAGFEKTNFAKWVINKRIETALSVRDLKGVLDNAKSRKVFLTNNITEAKKVIEIAVSKKVKLGDADILELLGAIHNILRDLSFEDHSDIMNKTERGVKILDLLNTVSSEIDDVINSPEMSFEL